MILNDRNVPSYPIAFSEACCVELNEDRPTLSAEKKTVPALLISAMHNRGCAGVECMGNMKTSSSAVAKICRAMLRVIEYYAKKVASRSFEMTPLSRACKCLLVFH